MNKFQFILEYQEYIKHVNELFHVDDKLMYEKFLSQSKNGHLVLLEGLITTHPIDKSVNIIKNRFPNLNIKIENDGEIYIDGNFGELKKYLSLFTNLGYFISLFTIDGEKWLKNYDNGTKPIALYLEPLYDLEMIVPTKLFHTSSFKHKYKISKIGFIPKTGNKLSNHPDRIYLTDNFNVAYNFGLHIKKETGEGFCVYEINSDCINYIYSDINLKNGGYYTKQNISPKCFKIIKEE